MSGGGNQYTLAALATTASHSVPRSCSYSLQHRHPDGRHWLEIGRFATRHLAKETMAAFVAADYGPKEDFRVRKLDPHD
jgi:hypothetical protein